MQSRVYIEYYYLRRRTFRFPSLLHACDITTISCAWKGMGERSRAPPGGDILMTFELWCWKKLGSVECGSCAYK